jgi:hypothetical protein
MYDIEGGACMITIREKVNITETVFDSCSASGAENEFGCGGALAFSYNTENVSSFLLLSHLFFNQNFALTMGLDIIFIGEEDIFSELVSDKHIMFSRSLNTNKNITKVTISSNFEDEINLSDLLPQYFQSPLYIAPPNEEGDYKVANKPYCGLEIFRCRTVSYGDTTTNPSESWEIMVANGEYPEDSVKTHSKSDRIVLGTSVQETRVVAMATGAPYCMFDQFADDSSLLVSNFTITLMKVGKKYPRLINNNGYNCIFRMESIVIFCNDVDTSFEDGLIYCYARGTFVTYFTNVTISSMQLNTAAISGWLSLRSVFSVRGCSFTNLWVNSDASIGGALYCRVVKGCLFEVKDFDGIETVFKNCSLKSAEMTGDVGCGGAVGLLLERGFVLTKERPEFLITSASFIDCFASKGNNVYIGASVSDITVDFDELDILYTLSAFVPFAVELDSNDIVGFDSVVYIPLNYYFFNLDAVYVRENGLDAGACGFSSNPCSSLNRAIIRTKDVKSDNPIIYVGDSVSSENILFSGELTITTHITINVPVGLNLHQRILIGGITASLLFAESGTVGLMEFPWTEFVEHVTSSLIVMDGVGKILLLDDCMFRNADQLHYITLNSVITVIAGNLVINRCEFWNIESANNRGSILNGMVISGSVLNITGSSFLNCSISGMYAMGGAVFVNISQGGKIIMIGKHVNQTVTFFQCGQHATSSPGGRGGAVAVYVNNGVSDTDILFGSELSFWGCYANVGSDIYLDAFSLALIVTRASFAYSYSLRDRLALAGISRHQEDTVELLYVYLCPLRRPSGALFDCDEGCVEYLV